MRKEDEAENVCIQHEIKRWAIATNVGLKNLVT